MKKSLKSNPELIELIQSLKKLSGSSIASNCPLLYFEQVMKGLEPDFPFEHARPGKEEHFYKEHVNKHNPRALIVEETLYLKYDGDKRIKPFLLRVTPDYVFQDIDGISVMDYKTSNEKGWYFKYKYFNDGLPTGYKMQLSLQKYVVFLHHGILPSRGYINFIMLTNDKTARLGGEMKIPTKLFDFHEIEEFIFTHPAVTENIDDIAEPTKRYHAEYKGLCNWKGCNRCDDLDLKRLQEELDLEGEY